MYEVRNGTATKDARDPMLRTAGRSGRSERSGSPVRVRPERPGGDPAGGRMTPRGTGDGRTREQPPRGPGGREAIAATVREATYRV